MQKIFWIVLFVICLQSAGQVPDINHSEIIQNMYRAACEVEIEQQQTAFDPWLMDLLVQDCPDELKILLTLSPAEFKEYCPQAVLFVGPPGVGKSTLARYIGMKFGFMTIMVNCSLIANEYKNSGCQNLARIIEPLLHTDIPHLIILDEITVLVQKNANPLDNDSDMVVALWTLFDQLKQTPHKVIATANTIEKLPTPLKDRFINGIFRIPFPSLSTRQAMVNYYLQKTHLYYTNDVVRYVAQQVKRYSCRMIESLIDAMKLCALLRASKAKKTNTIQRIAISKQDGYQALKQLRQKMNWAQYEPNSYYQMLKDKAPVILPYIFQTAQMALSIIGLYVSYQQLRLAWDSMALAKNNQQQA